MWTVTIFYEDGQTGERGPPYPDLESATSAALALADWYGKNPHGDGHGAVVNVTVRTGSLFELEIAVIKGGLAPPDDPR